MSHSDLASSLLCAVQAHSSQHGATLLQGVERESRKLVSWIDYLSQGASNEQAGVLLDGTRAAVLETAGALSLGLARAAIFALRAQIDMILAWLYFKDHGVEWKRVETAGEGYKLKKDILKYLNDYLPRFRDRFSILTKERSEHAKDPYRLLSAHVHSQSSLTVPSLDQLSTLVAPITTCNECVQLQGNVSTYLGDVLLSSFADNWADLPLCVRDDARNRLGDAKLRQLCA